MSTMKFNRKPPLAVSPVRTRPLQSITPPGSLSKSALRCSQQ
ncbi:unnamed protein product [Rhodiola kirilowii]